MLKTHILFDLNHGPMGGGNQFLKAIRGDFRRRGAYAEQPAEADVVLFNSYQFVDELLQAKHDFPDKVFVHRVDGPIRLYNALSDKRDGIVNTINRIVADATIFQSNWSREQNHQLGLSRNRHEATIMNAPDSQLFFEKDKRNLEGKTRLIATSWSSNVKKGFDDYRWLDENLDFNEYEMSFVGRSPCRFRNIVQHDPVSSEGLAAKLAEADVFVTASQKDPCSNSLIEAMHCGLPAVALNDGGHPEIVKQGGELFDRVEEIPALLGKIVRDYERYVTAIDLPTMDETGAMYLSFLEDVHEKVSGRAKAVGWMDVQTMRWSQLRWKLNEKFGL